MGAPQLLGVIAIIVLAVVLSATTIAPAALKTEGIHVDDSPQSFPSAVDLVLEDILDCEGSDDSENDEPCVELRIESILPEQPKIAESDDNVVSQFLDSIFGSKAIGIETVAVKYDLAGNSRTTSSILPIPLDDDTLSVLSGDDDFLLDNIQVAFFAISPEEITAINIEGRVSFYLDDEKIISKQLWVSTNAIGENRFPLFVVNSIPPPLSDRPETFDFTFTDEFIEPVPRLSQETFENQKAVLERAIEKLEGIIKSSQGKVAKRVMDMHQFNLKNLNSDLQELIERHNEGLDHKFTVIIDEIKGDLNGEQIRWKGEFIAYELKLSVDEEKVVILNEDNEAVEVLKSDSAIISCSQSEWDKKTYVNWKRNTTIGSRTIPASTTLDLQVFNLDNELVAEIESFTTTKNPIKGRAKHISDTPTIECKKEIGLMRSTEYIIKIDGQEFPYTTPQEQNNISASFTSTGKILLRPVCSQPDNCNNTLTGWKVDKSFPIILKASSNFGYSLP